MQEEQIPHIRAPGHRQEISVEPKPYAVFYYRITPSSKHPLYCQGIHFEFQETVFHLILVLKMIMN